MLRDEPGADPQLDIARDHDTDVRSIAAISALAIPRFDSPPRQPLHRPAEE